METAQCIAETTDLPMGVTADLDEVRRPAFVPNYEQMVHSFFDGQGPEDWESMTEAQVRVQKFIDLLTSKTNDEHVALVGHGLLWTLTRSWLLGQTRPDVQEWRAIAMPDFSCWNITDSGVALMSDFRGIQDMR